MCCPDPHGYGPRRRASREVAVVVDTLLVLIEVYDDVADAEANCV